SGLPLSLRFLADPEPLLRWAAVRNLEEAPRRAPLEAVLKALDDPVRLVRIEAARVFSALPAARQHPSFARAAAEFEESQRALSDQWGAHHNLGVFYENLGRLDEAQACYETSLRLEPKAGPPRINLAMLHYRRGLRSEAERQLRRAAEETPDLPEAPYFLGLLLAEDERRLGEALGFLERACRHAPSWARARYNFGLALQKLGRLTEAETELREACRLDPSSRDAWYALYILLLQTNRHAEADAAARALRRLSTGPPGDPGADPGRPAPQ
ncbi:MAG: tetratricopeptide repeat protein, partial [Planctomycetota bacterium]